MNQTPVKKKFRIEHRGEVGSTRNDNLYLETDTDVGTVAFWGKRNIDEVEAVPLPVAVECDVIDSNWPQHRFWVLERSEVSLQTVRATPAPAAALTAESAAPALAASADELNQWRHRLLRLLDHMFGANDSKEGPISRITGLKKEGRIPRRTAALMIAVTELRNAAEYEGADGLSPVEGEAARAAWKAVSEWAKTKGVDVTAI
jgi:hypothetical protein